MTPPIFKVNECGNNLRTNSSLVRGQRTLKALTVLNTHALPVFAQLFSKLTRWLLMRQPPLRLKVAAVVGVVFLAGQVGLCGPEVLPGSNDLVRGAVLAFYSKETSERYAVVRIERVYLDYRRKGFFRIAFRVFAQQRDVIQFLHLYI